ncbi:hypothetical protein, partial [Microbacterium sp.]|uniref:hypothetical protein n=1 Tax=Microbacterium sp. TaxID=51671 RepID=UPI0031FF118C|nr:hypothetical protein [Microbacterium sp.]
MTILQEQGHAGKAHELAHGLAGVVASAPFSLPGLQELVEWMKAKKISRQDLVDGVVGKMHAVVAPNDMPA